jgi:hypothetical protein
MSMRELPSTAGSTLLALVTLALLAVTRTEVAPTRTEAPSHETRSVEPIVEEVPLCERDPLEAYCDVTMNPCCDKTGSLSPSSAAQESCPGYDAWFASVCR